VRRSFASVSVDLDNIWAYQRTLGDPEWVRLRSYLRVAVPRMLEALDRAGCRATVFIVGADAGRDDGYELLRPIVRHGHEVGNHSYAHACWLHRSERVVIRDELQRADQAIRAATGAVPVGFRGPGFTWSRRLLEVVAELGYRFDASLLPSFLAPVARWRLLQGTSFTPADRVLRADLFGHFRDGFRPNGAFSWELESGRRLLEIPVTTMPGLRLPFHQSYLVFLASFSRPLAIRYLRAALALCRRAGVEPSLLLHPLDWMAADEAPGLRSFPGMGLPVAEKLGLLDEMLRILKDQFTLEPMGERAERLLAQGEVQHRTIQLRRGATDVSGPVRAIPISGESR
jgi:hypothetical protein